MEKPVKDKAVGGKSKALPALIIVVVILVLGAGGWYVSNMREDSKNKDTDPGPLGVTQQPVTFEENTDTKQGAAEIKELISKGEYQSLEAHINDNVLVVRHGTDGTSLFSKADAIKTITEYFAKTDKSEGVELPWNFEDQDEVKDKLQKSSGMASKYVGQGNIGVSKNDWVFAFNIDGKSKIDSVYLSNSLAESTK